MFRKDFNFNITSRGARQIDRTDALLGGFNIRDQSEYPLQDPTGEKTRKTYDFTKSFHVGTSCHDVQATQGKDCVHNLQFYLWLNLIIKSIIHD